MNRYPAEMEAAIHPSPSEQVSTPEENSDTPRPANRSLRLLEHTVHKIEKVVKDDGTQEDELVVSNVRSFDVRVGVVDSNNMLVQDMRPIDLQAELLYENGMPVEKLNSSAPLLMGNLEAKLENGEAHFKLRITLLSSQRDKQRFRLRIAPKGAELASHFPCLFVVTNPMKSVTKLRHSKAEAKAERQSSSLTNSEDERSAGMKRKDIDAIDQELQRQEAQITKLVSTTSVIVSELKKLKKMAIDQHMLMAKHFSEMPSNPGNGTKAANVDLAGISF